MVEAGIKQRVPTADRYHDSVRRKNIVLNLNNKQLTLQYLKQDSTYIKT